MHTAMLTAEAGLDGTLPGTEHGLSPSNVGDECHKESRSERAGKGRAAQIVTPLLIG